MAGMMLMIYFCAHKAPALVPPVTIDDPLFGLVVAPLGFF